MVFVTHPADSQSGMPRSVKRRRTIRDEDAPFPEVAAPFRGLGEGDFSSGTVREDVDVRRELLGILAHGWSSFVMNALQAYRLVDNLVLDHLRLTDSAREMGSLKEALRFAKEELDQAKVEMESLRTAHQADLEKERAEKWEALNKQRDLEARLAVAQDELLKTKVGFNDFKARIPAIE